MIIRVASDLHLEGMYGRDYQSLVDIFLPKDERDAEAVLVLAGDVSSKPDQLCGFLAALNGRFKAVIYIAGNHEYYRHEYHRWNVSMIEDLRSLQMRELVYAFGTVGVLELDGVRFVYGTLWGDGGKDQQERFWVDQGINDFRLIRLGDERFTSSDMARIHVEQRGMFRDALKNKGDQKVVAISHHMPSYSLCHPRFGTSINGGFAAYCDDLLHGKDAPDLWIHGHTHDTIDRKIGDTRVVCNPAGYRGEWNTTFNQYWSSASNVVEAVPVFVEL